MAAIATVPAMAQQDGAFVHRIRLHLELVGEAPHEQALKAGFAGVTELGFPRSEATSGGVDAMDEVEQLACGRLDAASEHVVRIERSATGASVLGHGRLKDTPSDKAVVGFDGGRHQVRASTVA
ncbi:MAG: hypothetical protein QM820_32285 [Minicystis sp.]